MFLVVTTHKHILCCKLNRKQTCGVGRKTETHLIVSTDDEDEDGDGEKEYNHHKSRERESLEDLRV